MQQKTLEQQANDLLKKLRADTDRLERHSAALQRDITTLEVKKTAKVEELEQVDRSVQAATDNLAKLMEQVAKADTAITRMNDAKDKLQAEIDQLTANKLDLIDEIDRKHVNINTELAKYREARREELETGLAEITDRVATATESLTTVQGELSEAQTRLTTYRGQLECITDDIEQAQEDKTIALEQLEAAEAAAKERVATVTSEIQHLELLRKQVARDLEKARAEHLQFKEYEAAARKALQAADESLQKRAREIEQSESMLVNRRSFLPKM